MLFIAVFAAGPASSQDRAQVFVTDEGGFGRLVISFPDRLDLPKYDLRVEHGVMSLAFDEPFRIALPDVASVLPSYVTIARIDPDSRGIRLGLRNTLSFNALEAGEKLFVDLLPASWRGMPPGLPPEVVAALAERARDAAVLSEQRRKAEAARALQPVATVRVGHNPTFMRIQFSWSIDTEAEFKVDDEDASLDFEWPVPIDLGTIATALPAEIESIANTVGPDGSRVSLVLKGGAEPRFYKTSDREYILDIDIGGAVGEPVLTHEQLAEAAMPDPHPGEERPAAGHESGTAGGDVAQAFPTDSPAELTPYVSAIGSTIRLVFPFEQDTPAAVFRRGDTIWMLFDTATAIRAPGPDSGFERVAREFSANPAGDTQVVRIELATDRLTTLGSEGRAWVLSLGDILLNPTEPIEMARRKDSNGLLEMTAHVEQPARVHAFLDPVVGDHLTVVTVYPPARGMVRSQEFVDFAALQSIHGLVLKPAHEEVAVSIEAGLALIKSAAGLQLSDADESRTKDFEEIDSRRDGFIDFMSLTESDPHAFALKSSQMMVETARLDGTRRDQARLELARFLVANGFAMEAIGILRVLESELKAQDILRKVRLTGAIANALAGRSAEALAALSLDGVAGQVDAQFWRAIVKADLGDYQGARADAGSARGVADVYPAWMRNRFLLAAARAAVETEDADLAARYLGLVEYAKLSEGDASLYQLLGGRIEEARGETDIALQTYGQVIASDIRPTRAEAIYRTMLVLDRAGTIDLARATQSLSAEAMLWRGTPLEADMLKLLAELYFREGQYRLGFETVKRAVQFDPESKAIDNLLATAQESFGRLFLDGGADALDPVEALAIYYDFREMTPPGLRGDEMIRNLARRLVKVDLLEQAAELLHYQVDNRLEGAARAQVASDLAVIYIADRRPELALRALNATRLADLAPAIDRQRRILEARALIDVGRQELALDLLATMAGRDVDLLRVDAHWRSRRYSAAAELLEVVHANSEDGAVLSKPARLNLIKAAVGFVLADDRIGLSRLRAKFADAMANSAEWGMFDYVTSEAPEDGGNLAELANRIAGVDSLNGFLASYKLTYGGADSLAPATAGEGSPG